MHCTDAHMWRVRVCVCVCVCFVLCACVRLVCVTGLLMVAVHGSDWGCLMLRTRCSVVLMLLGSLCCPRCVRACRAQCWAGSQQSHPWRGNHRHQTDQEQATDHQQDLTQHNNATNNNNTHRFSNSEQRQRAPPARMHLPHCAYMVCAGDVAVVPLCCADLLVH